MNLNSCEEIFLDPTELHYRIEPEQEIHLFIPWYQH